MLAYIDPVSLYRIARGNKYTSSIFKNLCDHNPAAKQAFFAAKQTFFEMQRLLWASNLDRDNPVNPVKMINFPKWNSEEAKKFNPIFLSDRNILETCRKFNVFFVKLKNPQAYEKYKNQIDNSENPGRFPAAWDPKQFYDLCKNIINAAGFTEQKIYDMSFSYNNENQSNNQQKPIPELKINKEKEKNL